MVKEWLANSQRLVAIVAPSFAATFKCSPRQLISGLRTLGFTYVFEVAYGAEICAYQYQKLLTTTNQKTIISTACPAVVLMVEKHFPHLINALAPIKSPMMITGDAVKNKHPHCKTVFIGPCIAKKAESISSTAGSSIDAVINFKQLKEWFKEIEINLQQLPDDKTGWDSPGANIGRLFPLAGGLLKTLGLHQDVGSLDIVEANGPVKCKSILRSISCGSLAPTIVDLLACDGCTSGAEIGSDELCFNKKKKIIDYCNTEHKEGGCQYPHEFAKLEPNLDCSRYFINKQPRIKKIFSEEEIWNVLRKTGKKTTTDLLNCGACGYETCRDKAIAVLRGKAELQMCLPFLLKQFQDFSKSMTSMFLLSRSLELKAATDYLTGLYNHRTFQKKLTAQIQSAKENEHEFALYIIDLDNFKQINDLYGHQTGDKILVEVANLIRDVFEDGFVARYGGEEFAAIMPTIGCKQEALSFGTDLVKSLSNKKFTILNGDSSIKVTASVGISCFPHNATNKEDLIKQADYSMYKAKRTKNNVVLYTTVLDDLNSNESLPNEDTMSTIKTLNIVINAKDHYTYKHSERVVHYAETLGKRLGLSERELNYLRYGAFLHDIGKIKVDMSILLKPDRLNDAEYNIIKKHPLIGADIAKEIPTLHNSIPVILYHHERYDGKGYPHGLRGTDIPLFGRIAAIADSFDAMTTDRPYKKGFTYKEALNELTNNAGTQFDPELIDLFTKFIKLVR
jgi:diguanylate cyclase (GGDEF)-like protein/putative nucleotidyltransferase with HDIG domain